MATAMREMALKSCVCNRFTPTTTQSDSTKRPAENKLDRNFAADAPNRKWVTDISVPQKRRERWEYGLPQSACRSRLQTTISGCG
jgi:transposase InsO family protein